MLTRHLLRQQISSRRCIANPPGILTLPRVFTTSSPSHKPRFLHRTRLLAKWSAIFVGSTAVGIASLGGCIFIHDAFTYNDKHLTGVPVSPLALQGETGGPKNLPLAARFLRDEEDEEMVKLSEKPRLVIVGGGWGVRLYFLFATAVLDYFWTFRQSVFSRPFKKDNIRSSLFLLKLLTLSHHFYLVSSHLRRRHGYSPLF